MILNLRKVTTIVSILITSIFITSCLGSDDDGTPTTQSLGYLTILNASPDSDGLKFYSNDEVLNSAPLNYNFLFGVYEPIGERSITVRSGDSEDLTTLDLNVELAQSYSVYAINKFENLELVAYNDNFNTPSLDKSMIRFIQLSHNIPEVKVVLEHNSSSTDVGSFQFKEASSFIDVNSGNSMNVHLIDVETNDTIFTKKGINLSSRKVYTIVSEGFYDSVDEDLDIDIQVITH